MELFWSWLVVVATFVDVARTLEVEMDGLCYKVTKSTCPDSEYIQFYLHTRSHRGGELVDVASHNISKTSFNPAHPTKVVIHGFLDNEHGGYVHYFDKLREAYFSVGDFNIIMVVWSRLAGKIYAPCYAIAASNTYHVGECTAHLIQQLRVDGIDDIHVLGHSLGAHAAHQAAKYVNPILPRITGLDPAGPGYVDFNILGFELVHVSSSARLNESDATFVDVVHTSHTLGFYPQAGHIDFYMNEGRDQPGCYTPIICDHFRAVLYYAESIFTDVGFYGNKCKDLKELQDGKCSTKQPRTILMGEYVSRESSGVVSVPTGSGVGYKHEEPFALGP